MKKIIFIAAFLLFIHTAPAQEGFSLGAHALYGHSGIISQNAYGFTELDPKFNSSFGGGLVAMYHITSMLGLTAEFNFMDMGGRWEGPAANIATRREVNLTYIQIPLLFRFKGQSDFTVYGEVGAQYGLLQDASQAYDPQENLNDFRTEEDGKIKNRFLPSDIGLVAGFGGQAKVANDWHALFGIRGSYGFTDINAKNWRTPNRSNNYDASKNIFAGIRLGILYNFASGF